MERTQISLESGQADRLRRLARARGVSMAHLIREAVERQYGTALAPPTRAELGARAMAVVGVGHSGLGDVSEHHDAYLEDTFAS